MKSLLILPQIKVERGNALSGLLYGFPAVTQFTGFIHSISRELTKLKQTEGLTLDGCSIICHSHKMHAHKSGYNLRLTQAKPPLNSDGKSPSFQEEGKIDLEVSLVIACNFTAYNFDFGNDDEQEEKNAFCSLIHQLAMKRPLAAGNIVSMSEPKMITVPNGDGSFQKMKRELMKLMPGFVLVSRQDIFDEVFNYKGDLADEMLSLCRIQTKSDEEGNWITVRKRNGWIVPIQAGYRSISDLYESEKIRNTRDSTTPFRFVEPIYSLGEWKGIHRIKNLEETIWKYDFKDNLYITHTQGI